MNRFLRAATLRMPVFSALLLCAATTARASEVDDLRAQLEALKSSYQTQIQALESRLTQLESQATTAPAAVAASPGGRRCRSWQTRL